MTAAAWVLLVPFDLSEVDSRNQPTGHGLDEEWWKIALVLAVLVAAGLAAAVGTVRMDSFALVSAGVLVWFALLTWEGLSGRTAGANLFIVPLVGLILPGVVVLLIVWRVVLRKAGR